MLPKISLDEFYKLKEQIIKKQEDLYIEKTIIYPITNKLDGNRIEINI